MNPPPTLSRTDFEHLVGQHSRLVAMVNELEFLLYGLGEVGDERVTACQQTAGALIAFLRDVLFAHDQTVFPILDRLTKSS